MTQNSIFMTQKFPQISRPKYLPKICPKNHSKIHPEISLDKFNPMILSKNPLKNSLENSLGISPEKDTKPRFI